MKKDGKADLGNIFEAPGESKMASARFVHVKDIEPLQPFKNFVKGAKSDETRLFE